MQDFSCPALLRCRLDPKLRFRVRGCHPLWLNFPVHSAIIVLSSRRRSFNPGACRNRTGLGCCAFARHYLRNHFCFLFLRVMRCFSSPGSPPSWMDAAVACGGLPHSEIRGSTGICPCPRLIAACHVLLRLREPRHPSCALLSFPFSESFRLFDSLTSFFILSQLCVGKNPYLGSSCEFALLRFLLRICSFFQFPICQCALFFV